MPNQKQEERTMPKSKDVKKHNKKMKKKKKPDITFYHPDLLEVPNNGNPYLKGYKCKACGKVWFPKVEFCPNPECWCEEMEVVPLSRRGTIYSYTDVFIGQANMKTYMPLIMAYVDLPEGIRLFAQIEGEVGSIQCGDDVELVVGHVRDNMDGKPITSYKFKKI